MLFLTARKACSVVDGFSVVSIDNKKVIYSLDAGNSAKAQASTTKERRTQTDLAVEGGGAYVTDSAGGTVRNVLAINPYPRRRVVNVTGKGGFTPLGPIL